MRRRSVFQMFSSHKKDKEDSEPRKGREDGTSEDYNGTCGRAQNQEDTDSTSVAIHHFSSLVGVQNLKSFHHLHNIIQRVTGMDADSMILYVRLLRFGFLSFELPL